MQNFTTMLGYTLTLAGTLTAIFVVSGIATKIIAADRMKQKARKVIDHIDIRA